MKLPRILLAFLMVVGLAGIADAGRYQLDHRGSSSIETSNIDFSGSGQNDINITGTYEGTEDLCYEVNVTATSTMKWRASCTFGSYTTSVSMTTSAVEIENGILLSWDTAAGHTATDSWKFKVKAVSPMRIKNSKGEDALVIDNDEDIRFFSGQISSQNAYEGLEIQDAVGTTYVKFNREHVTAKTTGYAILAADSGKWFITDSSANAFTYTLPTAVAGLKYGFIVTGTGLLTVAENGGDTIACGASTAGVSVTSATADDYIELMATSAARWVCTSVGPTVADWTYNN